jgi:signal transduction histidine kinase
VPDPGPPATTVDAAPWLAALTRVMTRVTAHAGGPGVLDALANGVVAEFEAALVRMWLYDPADHAMHARVTAGDVRDLSGSTDRIPVDEARWPVARALINRQQVVIEEIGPDSGIRDLTWIHREGLRSFAGFPLVAGDRLIGAMVVYRRSPLPPPLATVLAALAQQAALALEHERLTQESRALQEIATDLASARDPRSLLDSLVERAMAVFGADACGVWLRDEAEATAARGLSATFRRRRGIGSLFEEIRRKGQPRYTRNAAEDARARGDTGLADRLVLEGVVSALRLPLFAPGGQVVGMLALYHRRERPYSEQEIELAQAFSSDVAVALHNAELADQEQMARASAIRQVERLTVLTGITTQLLATTQLDTVLRVVAEAAARLCDADGAVIHLIEPDGRALRLVATHGLAEERFAPLSRATQAHALGGGFLEGSATDRALRDSCIVVVEDYTSWPPSPGRDLALTASIHAMLVAPLRVGGTTAGVLTVVHGAPRKFGADDVAMVEALADQAALAIEHTRLVGRAQDAAVLEERARLARDLHDSVTQSVFSLGMLARAARTQHQRGSGRLSGTLERISTIAQEALAEMRSLLLELRPPALTDSGLDAALEQLVASARGRTETEIAYRRPAGTSPRLLEAQEVAVYRIAQEALGNAIKHARATTLTVSMEIKGEQLRVAVQDNGVGFDPAAAMSEGDARGGMGMHTMRERAASAGLALEVKSAPGHGTTVGVTAILPTGTEDVAEPNPQGTG